MSEKRDPVRVIMMWGLLLIYGMPTIFILMCGAAGFKEVPWFMIVWGGTATAFALWLGEQPAVNERRMR